MSADARFVGCCVFASDFQAHEWYSFDVEPAYNAILAVKPTATKPIDTFLPAIGTGTPKPAYIAVPSGANLRKAPRTDGDLITAIPYGEQILVYPDDAGPKWSIVEYQGNSGYMSSSLFSFAKPAEPVRPPSPTGDNFARCLAFVRRWEGGWADNPADPGGATMKGITLDTYTRWRKEHGQPQPTKADLRNLTDAEADQIFHDWYWLASGADKLPWPLCLAHFDTAVNAGPGRAQETLAKSNGNFSAYLGHLLTWYASIDDFETFGRAWTRRRADLLIEGSK
jgi:hypothetical protein